MSEKPKWYSDPAAVLWFWFPFVFIALVFALPPLTYAASKWAKYWDFNWNRANEPYVRAEEEKQK